MFFSKKSWPSGFVLGVMGVPLLCLFNTAVAVWFLANRYDLQIPRETLAVLPVDLFLALPAGLVLGEICDRVWGHIKSDKMASARRLCWGAGGLGFLLFSGLLFAFVKPSAQSFNLFHELYCCVLSATCALLSLGLVVWGAALRVPEKQVSQA